MRDDTGGLLGLRHGYWRPLLWYCRLYIYIKTLCAAGGDFRM